MLMAVLVVQELKELEALKSNYEGDARSIFVYTHTGGRVIIPVHPEMPGESHRDQGTAFSCVWKCWWA